jgi:hypothetical protein
VQQRAAVGITPLQVIDQHSDGCLLRDRREELCNALEEPPPVGR